MPQPTYDHTDRTEFDHGYQLDPPFPPRLRWCTVLQCGHVKTRPGWGIAKRSNGFLLQYIAGGYGWLKVEEKPFAAGPGDVIFLDCLLPHELGVDPERSWEIYWAEFDSAFARVWAERLDADLQPVSPARDRRLRSPVKVSSGSGNLFPVVGAKRRWSVGL